jgi:hypothetical protein
METIKQQLNIPANHRVKFDIKLPDEIPTGEAELIMIIAPRSVPQDRRDIMELAGSLRHSMALREDPLSIQKRWRDEW